jgi:hypothetical protein
MRQMTTVIAPAVVLGSALLAAALAQDERPRSGSGGGDAEDLVNRMMAFDENHDGKLTKTEITDARLHRLFARADANKDGTVTNEELTALAARESSSDRGGGPGGGGPGGGPPGGGFGGPMMFSRPGEVLPPMLRQRLKLTGDQVAQLADLQKEVDARLDKILNADQKELLKAMRNRGPGGPGGPRGPVGRRRPPGGPGGGPPPGGEPRPR